jgi:hypothetical protein
LNANRADRERLQNEREAALRAQLTEHEAALKAGARALADKEQSLLGMLGDRDRLLQQLRYACVCAVTCKMWS